MQEEKHNLAEHDISYTPYLFIWISLLALTSITVTVAGLDLGNYTLVVAMSIAAIKSALVINIFMHIKFEDTIFKVFIAISFFTLSVIFILTFLDFLYR
ncbi:MAG: cytochrome C oxidase subunit IV family protein [Melioribacteraceae bacterium]